MKIDYDFSKNAGKALTVVSLVFLFLTCQPPKEQPGFPQIEGISYWDELIRQNPEVDSLYAGRADFLIEQESYDSAIVDYLKAISLDSLSHPEYYINLSKAYLMVAQSHRAGEILDKALAVFPNHKPTLLNVTELKLVLKQYLPALGILNKMFQLDPENADAYYLAGHVYYEMGDTGRAVNAYQKAVDLNPEMRNAWIQLGDVLTALKIKRAMECYDNAIRLDSSDPRVFHNKAYALGVFEKKLASFEQFKQLVIRFPDYEPGFYYLGLQYLEMDSIEKAIEHFNICIQLQPTEASSYVQRAKAFAKSNRRQEAITDLKNAMNLDAGNLEAKKLLDEIQ